MNMKKNEHFTYSEDVVNENTLQEKSVLRKDLQ